MNKFGIMIMSGFAALWFAWGLSGGLSGGVSALHPLRLMWFLLPLVVSGAMMVGAMRLPVVASRADKQRVGRIVGWASAAEGVAILIASNVLNNVGLSGYVVIATLVIVGLHFLPLGYYMRVPAYYVTAAAMIALALFGCTITADGTRLLVTGTGAAILLWLTCLSSFARRPEGQEGRLFFF